MKVSYYKNTTANEWGLRLTGDLPSPEDLVGRTVVVNKKDGSAKEEVIDYVTWRGTDRDGASVCLAKIRATDKRMLTEMLQVLYRIADGIDTLNERLSDT